MASEARWPAPLVYEVVERRGQFYIKLDGQYQRDGLWRKTHFDSREIAEHFARMWAHQETADDLRREIRGIQSAGHPVDRVIWERLRFLEAAERSGGDGG